MPQLRLLLAAAILTGAHSACCCWAAAPDELVDSPASVVRSLPDITPAGGDSVLPIGEQPAPTDEVVPTKFEAYVFDEAPAESEAAAHPQSTRLFESTWYTRVDYFNWTELINGQTFMQNNGAIPTLGYQRRHGRQRVARNCSAAGSTMLPTLADCMTRTSPTTSACAASTKCCTNPIRCRARPCSRASERVSSCAAFQTSR